jgi:transposase
MLTQMTTRIGRLCSRCSTPRSRGEPGQDDRKFLEAIFYFTVHNITWRVLPVEFGNWNSVWKRLWRLNCRGAFVAFFQLLAE